ncbi:hypothetical protein [Paenibacillus sp. Aloe-11]|uniref:hypothetical protein n=1 Tax=Paenibacillus sp. Aloe-11 TaxID=1050222 RepID=UPI00024EF5AA|nr:hypothetical protein [Paenibacillus sp. Aloe-11]EHS58308.1 hypothetical protein WG8_1568 [Paenibacillus sp. Aloe-11]
MKDVPFGYELNEEGKLVAHPFESKVVKLNFTLSQFGLNEEEIVGLFTKHSLPRRGQNYDGFVFEDKLYDIFLDAHRLQMDKVEELAIGIREGLEQNKNRLVNQHISDLLNMVELNR